MAAVLVAISTTATAEPADHWWNDEVEKALGRAKPNRSELEMALAKVPRDQRRGLAFLITNMPDGDLKSLKADFLLVNLDSLQAVPAHIERSDTCAVPAAGVIA